MDELFTFIGQKNRIYILTIVDRQTRCCLGWKVVGKLTDSAEHTHPAWFPLAGPLPEMAFPTDAAVIACLARGNFQGLSVVS